MKALIVLFYLVLALFLVATLVYIAQNPADAVQTQATLYQ